MKDSRLASHLTAEATNLLREELLKILGYPFGLPLGADSMNIDQLLQQIYNERIDLYAQNSRAGDRLRQSFRSYDELCRYAAAHRTGYEGMP